MKVKTRFAPSSTGYLHFGSIRTALYSWLLAKRNNGSFVLRIEDTDFHRSNSIFIKNILKSLNWLGILWDEGPYLQSDRLSIYQDKITELLDLGYAYRCYCSIERLNKIRSDQISKGYKPCYDRKCRNITSSNSRNYVIRFKNPISGKVIFNDLIRGKIVFNNSELDDLIIQRQNGIPTYNFCVVVDDLDMKITHVIRGEDHINNTPRQINIFNAFNYNIPYYGHLSMVVNHDKSNLSKRKHAENILEYKKEGFLRESVLNYLIRLGWSYGNREIFSIDEMKKMFSINNVSKSSSELDFKKLLWYNSYYLKTLPIDDYIINNFKKQLNLLKINFNQGPELCKIINFFRKRCTTLKKMAIQSYYFFYNVHSISLILINKYLFFNFNKILNILYNQLFEIEDWISINIIKLFKTISIKFKLISNNLFMLVRIAITASDNKSSLGTIMEILGKFQSLFRIKNMLNQLKHYNPK